MNKSVLIDIFSVMNIVIIERLDDVSFHNSGEIPQWFLNLFCKNSFKGNNLQKPSQICEFLENFMIDANNFWDSKSTGKLKSGIWIEVDSDGKEYALEATSISLNESKILLIELLNIFYQDRQSIIQKGRELNLDYYRLAELKEALHKSHDELEHRVAERTLELRKINTLLRKEIAERKSAEGEVRTSHEKLHNLSKHMELIREEEKKVISREIHDDLGQVLTALKMDVAWLEKRFQNNQKSILEKTKSMKSLIDLCIKSVQKISTELRPGILDDLGLIAAIEWAAEEFHEKTEIKCEISSNIDEIVVDPDYSIAVFRTFQEILRNIYHHAHATKVNIIFKKDKNSFILHVKDNGTGITDKQINDRKSLGIIGIQERAKYCKGSVEISGSSNKGTTITLMIPLLKD